MNFILRCFLMYISSSFFSLFFCLFFVCLFFIFFFLGYTFKGSPPSDIWVTIADFGDRVYVLWFTCSQFFFKLFCFPPFRLWACLIRVIPEMCRAHYIWYLRFYFIKSDMEILFTVSLCIVLFICTLQFNLWGQILLKFTMWKVERPNSSYRLKLCATIRKCTTVFVPLEI